MEQGSSMATLGHGRLGAAQPSCCWHGVNHCEGWQEVVKSATLLPHSRENSGQREKVSLSSPSDPSEPCFLLLCL